MKLYCLSTITKAATVMLATALSLTACSSTSPNLGGVTATEAIGTANNIGMAVFKTSVNQYCLSEVKNNSYYKAASIVMTQQQQTQVASSVCGCVTEQAPQQITVVDAANAALDANYRTQLVTHVVAKSLQTCVANFVKR